MSSRSAGLTTAGVTRWSTACTFPHRAALNRRASLVAGPLQHPTSSIPIPGRCCTGLIFNRIRGGTAAVIVEPLGPESGTRPVPFDFNQKIRELCDQFGALLIFDEVVTGFRMGLGGAQGYFGVEPDLTVFGKCITGGYPMAGGVGGRADVIRCFAAGIGGIGERAYIGGTLSANPLSCVAGYYAILEMERTNAPVIAGQAGDRLRLGLEAIIDKLGLPFVAYNQGSIVHLETAGVMLLDLRNPLTLARELKPRKHMMEEMGAAYMSARPDNPGRLAACILQWPIA